MVEKMMTARVFRSRTGLRITSPCAAAMGAIASTVSGSRGKGGRKSGPQILRNSATATGS